MLARQNVHTGRGLEVSKPGVGPLCFKQGCSIEPCENSGREINDKQK